MPDIYMDVDAAVTVPVNILPLIDDTDFKTIEQDIVYDQAGMDLVWHFVTCAGVITATAVTPTTGGNYDWSEDLANKGTYKIEIPASGGASINNDTEGFGWFTGVATGVLPWRGPVIGFRAAALNNAYIDGGDVPDVSVTEINGDSSAAAKLALSADAIITGTVDNTAFAPTTTQFEADDVTEATSDHYNGRVIIFTSGALTGQATSISDYVISGGRGHFTVPALTEAAGNDDTFIII
jgi:hypothetical protein